MSRLCCFLPAYSLASSFKEKERECLKVEKGEIDGEREREENRELFSSRVNYEYDLLSRKK